MRRQTDELSAHVVGIWSLVQLPGVALNGRRDHLRRESCPPRLRSHYDAVFIWLGLERPNALRGCRKNFTATEENVTGIQQ